MFKPFFLFVGLRYARAKRKNHFISFISLTSMLGIAIGVTALITVLSVMNGFNKEIRAKMLNFTPHVIVRSTAGNLYNWQSVYKKVETTPGIIGAAPYIASQGLLVHGGTVEPTMVQGVDPTMINNVYPLAKNIKAGNLAALKPGRYGIILSEKLAQAMGLKVGSNVTIMMPDVSVSFAGITPRMKRLTLVATFSTGTYYDNRNAFVNIQDASRLFKMSNSITGIQVKLQDELDARAVSEDIYHRLEDKYWVSNWTDDYASFFDALNMEKTVMWCILLLIIAVAAFNLVSSLVMMVTDKRADIAILRTMGATPRSIMGIFISQGAFIGLLGTVLGMLAGLLLASNITGIVEHIQTWLNIKFVTEDIYLIGFVPSQIKQMDVIIVCGLSFILSLLATIYPAWRAASIAPAEALRYE